MTQRIALHGTTAVLLALASTAKADVTPGEVWDNLVGFYEATGYGIETGSVTEAGDTVSVTGMVVSLPTSMTEVEPGLEMNVTMSMPDMQFTANSDGTVKVNMPDVYVMEIVIAPEGDETGTIGLSVDQAGVDIVAAGSADEVTYTINGPGATISLDSIMIPGEDGLDEAFDMAFTIGEYGGSYTFGSGDMPKLAMQIEMAELGAEVSGQEPGGAGALEINLAAQAVEYVIDATYLAGMDAGDLTAMLRGGVTMAGSMTHGGSTYDLSFQDRGDSFAMAGSASSGELAFDMGGTNISYSIGNTGMDLKMSGSEIPLPEVAISAASTLFGLEMPIIASDNAQDLGLSVRFEDFSVSDMIWGMLDPGAQLPRDPATVILELAGKANWVVDIMDPMAILDAPGGMPGALEAMDINELTVSIAGAELTGSGGFTFDMSDFSTFGGVPAPTGALDLNLSGANGLMDKLVAMGLLPQEQAMGARMMMGLFAKPGDGPDTLTSKIEVDGATGGITANGQRLQ